MVTIGFTGHRPDKMPGGYTRYNQDVYFEKATEFVAGILKLYEIKKARIGMAQGWDTIAAYACLQLDIPYTACMPFPEFGNRWTSQGMSKLLYLLERADRLIYTIDTEPATKKEANQALYLRNISVCEDVDYMFSYWNKKPEGGTYNCLLYCRKQGIPAINLWDMYQAKFNGRFKK